MVRVGAARTQKRENEEREERLRSEKEGAAARLGPRLKAWAEETGKPKNIRHLLGTAAATGSAGFAALNCRSSLISPPSFLFDCPPFVHLLISLFLSFSFCLHATHSYPG